MPAMIVEDHEDEWSTYKLLRMYIARAHYPGWTGLLFMRKCPAKYLKKRQSNVNAEAIKNKVATYTAHQGDCSPRSKGKMAGTCKGKMGISFPSIIYKRLAHRCGFINPDKFTGRSARRSGISKLVNAGVAGKIINQMARHTVDTTNHLYQELHDATYQSALTASHYTVELSESNVFLFLLCFFFDFSNLLFNNF